MSKTLKSMVVMILLLASSSPGAQGFLSGGAGSFGEEIRGPVQLRGTVLCAQCRLAEVR